MLRAKAQASGPGKWVYNLGGWSPDQFVEDKKLPTRDELDKVLAREPGLPAGEPRRDVHQQQGDRDSGSREDDRAVDPARRQRPCHGRHCPGGGGRVRDMADFLDAPNGGRANLPADVIRASSIAMLNDLNKAGLTASGGGCQFEELHRELKRMRFFCLHTPPGGRGAGAVEKQIALIPTMSTTTATSGATVRTGERTSPAAAPTTSTRQRSSRSRRNSGICSAASPARSPRPGSRPSSTRRPPRTSMAS